jgi:hypothetical protein
MCRYEPPPEVAKKLAEEKAAKKALKGGDADEDGDEKEDGEDEDEDENEDEDDEDEDDYFENRTLYLPDIDAPFKPPSIPAEKKVSLTSRKLQIIVKLANIELTPENPTYNGGSWHVEGMKNERIVASGIYYFHSENITESRLGFRQAAKEPSYEQGDNRGVREVYGLEGDEALNQPLGSLITQADRMIAFPNILQHQGSSNCIG